MVHLALLAPYCSTKHCYDSCQSLSYFQNHYFASWRIGIRYFLWLYFFFVAHFNRACVPRICPEAPRFCRAVIGGQQALSVLNTNLHTRSEKEGMERTRVCLHKNKMASFYGVESKSAKTNKNLVNAWIHQLCFLYLDVRLRAEVVGCLHVGALRLVAWSLGYGCLFFDCFLFLFSLVLLLNKQSSKACAHHVGDTC